MTPRLGADVPGPRDYTVASERALYQLARGACYAPQCDVPATVFIDGEPFSNLEIAHIHGANPGSPRYREDMTDDERRAFANLLLLCRAHHELVDRRRPDDYPASLLGDWKEAREAGLEPNVLAGITETQLEHMLEQVTKRLSLQRDVAVDILAGVLVPSTGGVLTGPVDRGFRTLLDANPSVSGNDTVMVLRLRNIGALAVNIQSIDLHVSLDWDDDSAPAPAMTLMGRNDFPHQNPTLPMRVEDGGSATWLVATSTTDLMIAAFEHANQIPGAVYGEFSLATGEAVRTEAVPVTSYRQAFRSSRSDT